MGLSVIAHAAPRTVDGMTTSPLPPSLAPERRSNMLPILAMTTAAIGLALSVVPSALLFAAPALALAVTLAIVALVKKSHGSKGLSFAAIGTAVVGLVVATAVAFTSLASATQAAPVSGDAEVAQEDAAAEPPLDEAPDPIGAQKLAVSEAEFGRDPSTPNGWWYLLWLDNPNPQTVLIEVPITLSANDANDVSLGVLPITKNIQPGKSVVSGYFKMESDVEVMSLGLNIPAEVTSTWSKDADFDYIDVSGITPGEGAGVTVVRGDLTNISDDEVTGVLVTVIARDSAGKIIAFANAEAASLAVGATTAFEAPFDLAVPADAEFEVFVEP